MMSLEILNNEEEVTAWNKWIHFKYEGENYTVLLHWDTYEGYDLTFTDSHRSGKWVKTPLWAENWEDSEGMTLEYALDDLSNEVGV